MTRVLTIFAAIILVSILLTDVHDAKFSCKNKHLSYIKVSDYAVEYVVSLQSKHGEFNIPNIDESGVEYSYMGECRYYFKAFITSGENIHKYEAVVVGNKNDNTDDWTIEKFKLISE